MDAFRNTQRPFVAPKSPKTPKTVKPKAPRITRPKLPDPNKVASDQAMSAFRQALAQLQQVTPQVDQAAIRAPYQAASVATGQLGGGLQAALLQSGQTAQSQYTAGLGQAQQQAAQFGISAGAGANPTALVNNGSQLIAQQTQAQAAAAPQAATAWQQLLERTAAAKVSDEITKRSDLIATGQATLASNIPAAIANEKDFGFKQKVQRENMGLAYSQLSLKDRQYAQQYGLDAFKTRQSSHNAATKAAQNQASLAEKARHNRVSETQAAKKLAQSQKAAQKKATASGIKGISQVNSILKPASGSASQKAAKGWDVTVAVKDPDTHELTGETRVLRLPRKDQIPDGFKFVSAETHYSTVPGKAAGGTTMAQWNRALAVLKASNPGVPASQLIPLLGPRPKK